MGWCYCKPKLNEAENKYKLPSNPKKHVPNYTQKFLSVPKKWTVWRMFGYTRAFFDRYLRDEPGPLFDNPTLEHAELKLKRK